MTYYMSIRHTAVDYYFMIYLQMFGYNAIMLILMIGVTAAAAYLWPQFKISMYPQYLICTVSSRCIHSTVSTWFTRNASHV